MNGETDNILNKLDSLKKEIQNTNKQICSRQKAGENADDLIAANDINKERLYDIEETINQFMSNLE